MFAKPAANCTCALRTRELLGRDKILFFFHLRKHGFEEGGKAEAD